MVSQWRVILATLIIFGSGVITGGLLVKNTQPQKNPGHHKDAVAPAPWQLQRAEFHRKIEHELDLTPEQKQHVEKIFKESQERMKPVWETIGPQMREEEQRVQNEINA